MLPRMPCTPCTKKSFPALESHTRFGDCVKLGVASERHKTTQKGMVPRNIQKKNVVTSRRRVIQHAASWTGPLLFTCERNLSILKSASSLNSFVKVARVTLHGTADPLSSCFLKQGKHTIWRKGSSHSVS